MRDNWMDLPEFNSGDSDFEVSHSLLVDRLQYLPNNTIEGTQVILVRAISGASSSTNLATAIHISGEEKVEKSNEVGSMSGIPNRRAIPDSHNSPDNTNICRDTVA